jgi:hypothetical protein
MHSLLSFIKKRPRIGTFDVRAGKKGSVNLTTH